MSQQFSRDTWSVTIPAGLNGDFSAVCDYFHVFSIVDGGGVEQSIQVSVNKPNTFSPVKSGMGGQGRVGQGDIQTLKFKNTTGAPVTVTLIYGNGAANFAGLVSVSGGQVSLSAATIASLLDITALTPICTTQPANGAPVVYSGFKSIEIIASGGPVNISSAGGMNFNIANGQSKEFSCENDQDYIADITVTPSATGGAEVTGLKVP